MAYLRDRGSHPVGARILNMAYSAQAIAGDLTSGRAVEVRFSRLRLWSEIVICFGLLEVALWTPRDQQLIWGLIAFGSMIALTIASRRSLNELGLGLRGLASARVVLPIAFAACALLLVNGWSLGWLHEIRSRNAPLWHGVGYFIWALEQQFMAQSFFFIRFESLLGSRRAVWTTAALFCFAHIPNPVLLPATFIAGLAFSEAFRRYRNIYPIALAHALLGLTLSAAFPVLWLHRMRVGFGYLLLRH